MTVAAIILSYFLGSVPFGYIITKFWKNIDVRNYGSGNIGFTNVLRTAGKFPGIIVLLLDIGKGFVSVLFIPQLAEITEFGGFITLPVICGLASIVGHNWSILFLFKGGKGISTTIGVFLAASWEVAIIGVIIWFIVVIITRYVSLGSILFVLSLPITVLVLHFTPYEIIKKENWISILILSIIAAFMAIYKHRGNIGRLLAGEERKIGQKVST